jgi:general secretion pathway protein N
MRWIALAAGFSAYALALVAGAPATLIDAALEHASHGRLRLAQAQGSLWSGSGWIEIRDATGRAGFAKRLAWQVLPESALRGRLTANARFDDAARAFQAAISPSRVEIADAHIDLPAEALGLGMPRLAPLRLTGELGVDIARLSVERGLLDGEVILRWRTAGSALTSVSPFGEYEVRLTTAGSVVQAVLVTLEGPLQIEGRGTWSNGRRPDFVATVNVPLQYQDQLAPLLRMVSIRRGPGSFEINANNAALGQ